MNAMQFSLSYQTPPAADALLVPFAKLPDMDPALAPLAEATGIPAVFIKAGFKAGLNDLHTLYFTEKGQNKRIFLLGLGESPRSVDIINAFRSFVFKQKNDLPANLAVSFLHGNAPDDPAPWIEAAVNGMLLGGYDIGLYKTDKKTEQPTQNGDARITIFTAKQHIGPAGKAVEKGRATAATQLEVFDLVNAPANKKTPRTLADWAVRSGSRYGYTAQVFDKKEIERLGFHALLAVSRGSEEPPTFIVTEYLPKDKKPLKKIALVGKGVTYDTGGLSIKPSANMYYMKTDMGGAAAVLGAVELVAKLQLPFHLVGIIPATENSVDALSVRPGDVIGSYNGKTIEVVDTDAEGRLILADGLSYAIRQFKPDLLIDIATLTGSCIRTLGMYAGGLFSNNDALAAQLLRAADKTGERLWQFPLWDDYNKELKSDIADIKNFSGNPSAGAITAAKFLEAFIEKHPAWAHLDIAGVAVGDAAFSSQKSATAYGVRLFVEFMESMMTE